jgi:hypothetical protein
MTAAAIWALADEMTGFAATAEETLKKIEADLEGNKGMFSVFSERMFTIRGTAQQLGLDHIAKLAGLGEELAIKGTTAPSRPHIRKCVGALWDAVTTIKYILVNHEDETSEEQEILLNRLTSVLASFGGARKTVSDDEIEALLKKQGRV